MTGGFLPIWAQYVAAIVAIIGGLGLLWRIFRKLSDIAEAMPILVQIADQFEIPTDQDRRVGDDRRDPRKVLPILIEIADQFQPDHGTSLYDRVVTIEGTVKQIKTDVERKL